MSNPWDDKECIRRHTVQVLENYKTVPGMTLVSMIMQRMGVSPAQHDWRDAETKVVSFLADEVRAGALVRSRGPKGGISLPTFTAELNRPIHGQQATVAVAVNDHVCPGCKNDRVSKSEKSCWKCGCSLH